MTPSEKSALSAQYLNQDVSTTSAQPTVTGNNWINNETYLKGADGNDYVFVPRDFVQKGSVSDGWFKDANGEFYSAPTQYYNSKFLNQDTFKKADQLTLPGTDTNGFVWKKSDYDALNLSSFSDKTFTGYRITDQHPALAGIGYPSAAPDEYLKTPSYVSAPSKISDNMASQAFITPDGQSLTGSRGWEYQNNGWAWDTVRGVLPVVNLVAPVLLTVTAGPAAAQTYMLAQGITQAAINAAQTGNWEKGLMDVGKLYAAQQVGQYVAGQVNGFLPVDASSIAKSMLSGAVTSGLTAGIYGKDINQAFLSGGISGGVGAIASQINGFNDLPTPVKKVFAAAVTAELQGKNSSQLNASVLQAALTSGVAAIANGIVADAMYKKELGREPTAEELNKYIWYTDAKETQPALQTDIKSIKASDALESGADTYTFGGVEQKITPEQKTSYIKDVFKEAGMRYSGTNLSEVVAQSGHTIPTVEDVTNWNNETVAKNSGYTSYQSMQDAFKSANDAGFKTPSDQRFAGSVPADDYYARKEGFDDAEDKKIANSLGVTDGFFKWTTVDKRAYAKSQRFSSYDDLKNANKLGLDSQEYGSYKALPEEAKSKFSDFVSSGQDPSNALTFAQAFSDQSINQIKSADTGTQVAGGSNAVGMASNATAALDANLSRWGGGADTPVNIYNKLLGIMNDYIRSGGDPTDTAAVDSFYARLAVNANPNAAEGDGLPSAGSTDSTSTSSGSASNENAGPTEQENAGPTEQEIAAQIEDQANKSAESSIVRQALRMTVPEYRQYLTMNPDEQIAFREEILQNALNTENAAQSENKVDSPLASSSTGSNQSAVQAPLSQNTQTVDPAIEAARLQEIEDQRIADQQRTENARIEAQRIFEAEQRAKETAALQNTSQSDADKMMKFNLQMDDDQYAQFKRLPEDKQAEVLFNIAISGAPAKEALARAEGTYVAPVVGPAIEAARLQGKNLDDNQLAQYNSLPDDKKQIANDILGNASYSVEDALSYASTGKLTDATEARLQKTADEQSRRDYETSMVAQMFGFTYDEYKAYRGLTDEQTAAFQNLHSQGVPTFEALTDALAGKTSVDAGQTADTSSTGQNTVAGGANQNAGTGSSEQNTATGDQNTVSSGTVQDTVAGGQNTAVDGSAQDTVTGSSGESTLAGGLGQDTASNVSNEGAGTGAESQDSTSNGQGSVSAESGNDGTQSTTEEDTSTGGSGQNAGADQNAGAGTDTGTGGDGSDVTDMGEIEIVGDKNASDEESDQDTGEDQTCAEGYHWNGSMCVADEDVQDESQTCPEGYVYDLELKQCVPVQDTVTGGGGGGGKGNGGGGGGGNQVVTPTPVAPPSAPTSPLASAKLDSSPQFLSSTVSKDTPSHLKELKQLYSSLTPGLAHVLSGDHPSAQQESKQPEISEEEQSWLDSNPNMTKDDLMQQQYGVKFFTEGGSSASDSGFSLDAPKFKTYSPSTLSAAPLAEQQKSRLGSLQQLRASLLSRQQGMAKGGLPDKYAQATPPGHKPEFITGLTGYYAQGKGTGQSDDIDAMLHDGDYVADADLVAALGDGSSKAGAEALEKFRRSIPHQEHASGGHAVPAKIADGEYVFPASFVTAIGKGDNKEGAKILDKMREAIRAHKRSAPTSKIPPKAKSPLDYLKMAKG